MPGLDVVRGFAILMVLSYHVIATFGPQFSGWRHSFIAIFEYGRTGVHLFFVLSGFLITGILIDSREDGDYYKVFYLRRLLRIVPAYLMMIAVLKL